MESRRLNDGTVHDVETPESNSLEECFDHKASVHKDIDLGGGALQSLGFLDSTELLSPQLPNRQEHRFGPLLHITPSPVTTP